MIMSYVKDEDTINLELEIENIKKINFLTFKNPITNELNDVLAFTIKKKKFQYKSFNYYFPQDTGLEWIKDNLEHFNVKTLSKQLKEKLGLNEKKEKEPSKLSKLYIKFKLWLIKYINPLYINNPNRGNRISSLSDVKLEAMYDEYNEEAVKKAQSQYLIMLMYIFI